MISPSAVLEVRVISSPESIVTLSAALISMLPASEVNSIDPAPVPWSAWILIVSEVPAFALK